MERVEPLKTGKSITHTGYGLHYERTASSDVLAQQEGGQEGDVVTERKLMRSVSSNPSQLLCQTEGGRGRLSGARGGVCSPAGRGREQRETGWICLDGWDVKSEGELRAERRRGAGHDVDVLRDEKRRIRRRVLEWAAERRSGPWDEGTLELTQIEPLHRSERLRGHARRPRGVERRVVESGKVVTAGSGRPSRLRTRIGSSACLPKRLSRPGLEEEMDTRLLPRRLCTYYIAHLDEKGTRLRLQTEERTCRMNRHNLPLQDHPEARTRPPPNPFRSNRTARALPPAWDGWLRPVLRRH